MIKKAVNQILEKEMDRKDFLKLVGLGAVAATGATAILKAMSQPKPRTQAPQASAYGASTYGGIPDKK